MYLITYIYLELPEYICGLLSLEALILFNNQLTRLPAALFKMDRLSTLVLRYLYIVCYI